MRRSQPGLDSRSLMLLVRLLCVLLPLVVLVTAAQMHLESLWEEGSPTVVAREEIAVVCYQNVLAEVIERLVSARVLLDACHHLVEVSWGLGQLLPVSSWLKGLLLLPLLLAGLYMDLNRASGEFNAAI